MIEIEKRFQPTEGQLRELLEGAEFLGEAVNRDIYYDYQDLRFFDRGIRLRNRNGSFELKINTKKGSSKLGLVRNEIEDEEEIKKFLNIDIPIQKFVDENMMVLSDYVNNRKKYKKGLFSIDLDDMDFGYKLCEVELMVEDEDEISNAKNLISEFIKQHGIKIKKIPTKGEAYLRIKNPELCKRLFG